MFLVDVFNELNRKKVRYLVAGGVAATIYGSPRFTKDLDLFVDLDEKNLRKLIKAFKALKFIPRAPVKPEDFISEQNRKKWKKEKGMLAFTFINPLKPYETVDILLVEDTISFSKAYPRKQFYEKDKVRIPVISREDLILMKRKAGRDQDLYDIEILRTVSPRLRGGQT